MIFEQKIFGKTATVRCENIIKSPNKKSKKKKVICNSQDFELLGQCNPHDREETEMLNGSRLLKLECNKCGNTIWKLCENGQHGKAN